MSDEKNKRESSSVLPWLKLDEPEACEHEHKYEYHKYMGSLPAAMRCILCGEEKK